MRKKVILLNGYAPFDPDPEREENKRLLEKLGIVRLTDPKTDEQMNTKPETLLEKRLAEMFPNGGTNTSSDTFFVVWSEGFQYLVCIHYGQWWVGDNALDERLQKMVDIKDEKADTTPYLVTATLRFKDEKYTHDYLISLFHPFPECSCEDQKVFFHCDTFEEFLGLMDENNCQDFVVTNFSTDIW